MPGQDHADGAQRPSRRAVLRGAAGAGAAGVAATAFTSLGAASAYAAETTQDGHARTAGASAGAAEDTEQFVVHVRDARTGQIDVFRGADQVRLHDRDLARHLDRISRR
jgi:hypothetical protein